jgi:uncharacterized lipoprotein YmbA
MRQQLPFFYYTLESSKQVAVPSANSLPDILVGPIVISSFLDKGQLVKQKSAYAITIEEQHRWAGNLQEMLTDALINNLSYDLGTNNIFSYPHNHGLEGLQLELTLLHFEKDSNGQALLHARWKISDTNLAILYSKTSTYIVPPENSSHSSLVQGLSIGLSNLSEEIGDAIRTVTSTKE